MWVWFPCWLVYEIKRIWQESFSNQHILAVQGSNQCDLYQKLRIIQWDIHKNLWLVLLSYILWKYCKKNLEKLQKKELSRSRLELETVCVLDRRDNHLHQRDLEACQQVIYMKLIFIDFLIWILKCCNWSWFIKIFLLKYQDFWSCIVLINSQ